MKKIAISVPIVVMLSLVAQGLGLFKNIELVAKFGATVELDIYLFTSTLALAIFSIISSAVTTIVIPELARKSKDKEFNEVIGKYIGALLVIGIIFSFSVILLMLVFRDSLFGKYSALDQYRVILSFTVLIIGQLFQIPQSYYSALLQINEHYVSAKLGILLQNAFPVLYLVTIMNSEISIAGVTVITAASFILTMFLTYYLKQFFAIKSRIYISQKKLDDRVKSLLKKTGPMFLSASVYQVQLIISGYLAVNYAVGTVTIFNNANQISGAIQGIVIVNILSLLYPTIVKKVQADSNNGLSYILGYNLILGLIISSGIALYFVVGKKLIELVFVHGKFTYDNGNSLFLFSAILIVGIIFDILRDALYRFYYAQGNTKIPTKNSIQTVIINLLLIACLTPLAHEKAIVLAPTIGTLTSLLSIVYRIKKQGYRLPISHILATYGLILMSFTFIYSVLRKTIDIAGTNIYGLVFSIIITAFYSLVILLIMGFILSKRKIIFK